MNNDCRFMNRQVGFDTGPSLAGPPVEAEDPRNGRVKPPPGLEDKEQRRSIMANLQVKGLDDDLYRALGARAEMDNRSISQEVVTMIQEFLGRPNNEPLEASRALMELAGSWVDDKPAAEIARALRKARRSRKRDARGSNVLA
jgi:plasmid stability protein